MSRSSLRPIWTSLVTLVATSAVQAQTYSWSPWTFPTGVSASASAFGLGTVTVTATSGVGTTNFPIHFDGVTFAPVDASGAAVQFSGGTSWAFDIDTMAVSNTSGVIIGLGNFGHSTPNYPGYFVEAYDTSSSLMSLATFSQLGSYDHTWPGTGFSFNDDISLNTGSGALNVVVVPGLDNVNSDVLLLSLPAGVGRIHVESSGTTRGDTVNILLAIPSPMVQSCRPGVDGGLIPCPCNNPPAGGGLGCDNFGAGPAQSGILDATGITSLLNDGDGTPSLFLHATGENNTSLNGFWTGKATSPTGLVAGSGVRCVQTDLKRLWFPSPGSNAVGGAVSKPSGADLSVSLETAALYGVAIVPGEIRYYQFAYRDPLAAGPCGNTDATVNWTNAGSITWNL